MEPLHHNINIPSIILQQAQDRVNAIEKTVSVSNKMPDLLELVRSLPEPSRTALAGNILFNLDDEAMENVFNIPDGTSLASLTMLMLATEMGLPEDSLIEQQELRQALEMAFHLDDGATSVITNPESGTSKTLTDTEPSALAKARKQAVSLVAASFFSLTLIFGVGALASGYGTVTLATSQVSELFNAYHIAYAPSEYTLSSETHEDKYTTRTFASTTGTTLKVAAISPNATTIALDKHDIFDIFHTSQDIKELDIHDMPSWFWSQNQTNFLLMQHAQSWLLIYGEAEQEELVKQLMTVRWLMPNPTAMDDGETK